MLAVQVKLTECDGGACPIPVTATVAGEFEALLTTESASVAVPELAGVNAIVSVLLALAASVNGKVAPETAYSLPAKAAEFTVIDDVVELFVRLTVCFVVLPTVTVPKSSDVGDTTKVAAAGA